MFYIKHLKNLESAINFRITTFVVFFFLDFLMELHIVHLLLRVTSWLEEPAVYAASTF